MLAKSWPLAARFAIENACRRTGKARDANVSPRCAWTSGPASVGNVTVSLADGELLAVAVSDASGDKAARGRPQRTNSSGTPLPLKATEIAGTADSATSTRDKRRMLPRRPRTLRNPSTSGAEIAGRSGRRSGEIWTPHRQHPTNRHPLNTETRTHVVCHVTQCSDERARTCDGGHNAQRRRVAPR